MHISDFDSPIEYYDKRFGVQAIKLLPGQYAVTQQEKLLVTVLGSCVAACVFDPSNGVGGMNHFMLPSINKTANELERSECMSTKYGIYAMEVLVNELVKSGAEKRRLQAKVFGGGRVVPSFIQHDVGRFNAEFVVNFLNTERIPIVASDLCEEYARKIYFFPATGSVFMKRIHELNNSTIIERESQHRWKLSENPVVGSIDLF